MITDVWIDNELSNQHLSDDKKLINLNFDIKNIKFRFAALDFKEPGNNMYSFRLVGFDDEWSQASNLRTASYTNLVPDTYYFEVRGSNSSNIWNPEVSSLGITIHPPWWQRWWAYTILGWGGYWAWDPVENSSLMPWLLMTAFIHSIMVQQKRNMFKGWNLFLIIFRRNEY